MALEINGFDILEAKIMETSIGAWTMRVELDAEEELTGPAICDIDGAVFLGTFRRGSVEGGRFIGEVIGGAGNLSAELDAKFYSQASLGLVIGDIMADAGEVLAPETLGDVELLTARVEAWSRAKGKAGLSIRQVVDETTAEVWRVQRNGTIFIGTDAFIPVLPDFEFDEIEKLPDQGKLIIAPEESPDIRPGVNFEGQNVSAVVTHVKPGGTRQEIFFADPNGEPKFDRVLGPLQRFIEQLVGRRIDYSQIYEAKVVVQTLLTGKVDVLPDDARIRGLGGLTQVPIFHGLPGVTALVLPGERCLIAFRNGDPKLPAVIGWADGGGGLGTAVTIDGLFTAKIVAGKVELTTHVHGGPGTPPVPVP